MTYSASDISGLACGAGSGSPLVSDDRYSDDENNSIEGDIKGSQGIKGQNWATYNSPVNDGWDSPSNFNRETYSNVSEHSDGDNVNSVPSEAMSHPSPMGALISPAMKSTTMVVVPLLTEALLVQARTATPKWERALTA